MLAIRSLLKPRIIHAAVRPLAIRALATPTIRTNVRPTPHDPVTTSPRYDIKESPLEYGVDMDVPKEFTPEDVSVEIDPNTKRIHVTGVHREADRVQHFEKDFVSGHPLDVDHIQADLSDGHLHLQVNKVYASPLSLQPETSVRATPAATAESVTAAPAYDIVESMFRFAVNVNLPDGFTADNVRVQLQPDARGVRITGRQGNTVFDKSFTAGHALDAQNVMTAVEQGQVHFEAPKMHA